MSVLRSIARRVFPARLRSNLRVIRTAISMSRGDPRRVASPKFASEEAKNSYERNRASGHRALEANDGPMALRFFRAAAATAPNSAEAWLSLGHVLSAAGDEPGSRRAFFRCLSIDLADAARTRGLEQFIPTFVRGSSYLTDLDPTTLTPRYPGIFIASLPKSGTAFLQDSLCEGLGKPPLPAPSGGLFPNATIAQSAVEELNNSGAVYVTHCAPTEYNITEVHHRLERLVVHVRDPRQALLSWVYFVPAVVMNADPVQRYHYGMPDDYESYSLERQIDWQIDHRLADIIAFMEGWWNASRRPGMKTKFLFTRHEDLSSDSHQFFVDLLNFYQIPASEFVFPPMPKRGERNFRSGETEEWRRVFTPAQIAKASAMIPPALAERFGWALA